MKFTFFLLSAVSITACTTIYAPNKQVQLLNSNSSLVNGCEKLGVIQTDTRGNPLNFDAVAEREFKKVAAEKYNADTAVITTRYALPFGQIRLEGTALKCYK